MKWILTKISFLLTLILAGCSAVNVDYNVPTGHFIMPETAGSDAGTENSTLNKIQTEFILQPVTKVSMTRVQQEFLWNNYTTDSDVSLKPAATIGANLAVSLSRRLDFAAKKCWDCPAMAGAKYQLIGAAENEHKPGFKMALAAFAGIFHEKEKSADVASIDGRKAEKVESNVRVLATEYHLIFGQRINPGVLFYLDNYFAHHELETEIVRQGGQKLNRDSNMDQYGGNLGIRISNQPRETRPAQTHLTVQGGLSRMKVFGWSKESRNLGAALGFTW